MRGTAVGKFHTLALMAPMSPWHRFRNPFYALLVVVGVLFCVTAFAYGVMTVRALQPGSTTPVSAAGTRLLAGLDAYGFPVMMVELGILAIATFAAMATDEYWERRARESANAISEAGESKA